MKTTYFTALLLSGMATTVSARCYGGKNKRPEHGILWVKQALIAGQNAEQASPIPAGQEQWTSGKPDGVCLSFGIKNKSGQTKSVTTDQVVDAWLREYIGCEHGGERRYDDGLEYIFHMDCK